MNEAPIILQEKKFESHPPILCKDTCQNRCARVRKMLQKGSMVQEGISSIIPVQFGLGIAIGLNTFTSF